MTMPADPLVPLAKLDPVEAWKPWEPTEKDPWSVKWVGHLYRRAGFSPTRDDVKTSLKLGLKGTLDRLFAGDPVRAQQEENFDKDGFQKARLNSPIDLRGWWVYRMMKGGHPLREKMVLFWHNHFATSINKIMSPVVMHKQNDLIRKHALTKFHPFLLEVSKDPAMLIWLDSNSNVKGTPNEQ